MKTIGMLGGMSWESTVVYYQLINRAVQQRLGGVHSAHLLMESYDFAEMAAFQSAGDWDAARATMEATGRKLAQAGADALIICCNTMHNMADAVERAACVPLLHIADPLGEAIRARGLSRVGLLGTSFTMSRPDVITGRLAARFGVTALVPEEPDYSAVHRTIYEELTRGQFHPETRALYREIMSRLAARGAEGIVLGCTEIPLLVTADDSSVPVFDTTTLHAAAAVEYALA